MPTYVVTPCLGCTRFLQRAWLFSPHQEHQSYLGGQLVKHFLSFCRHRWTTEEMMTSKCSHWRLSEWEATLLHSRGPFPLFSFWGFLSVFLFLAGYHWSGSISEMGVWSAKAPATLAEELDAQEEIQPLWKMHILTQSCPNNLPPSSKGRCLRTAYMSAPCHGLWKVKLG